MREVLTIDIGGTHVRFAIAELARDGSIRLGPITTLRSAEHEGLESAWASFCVRAGRPVPRAASLAVAGQAEGETLKLTNNPWTIPLAWVREELASEACTIVNDFGAVAHAVARVGPEHLRHGIGPDRPLPEDGAISIVGPGTGLGVALLLRRRGQAHIVETEGGHVGFAPADEVEDRILLHLRSRFGRISVERVVSGPALAGIYDALWNTEDRQNRYRTDEELWAAAMAGADDRVATAFERFCMAMGAVAGDIALAQGAEAVVIAGGLGLRLGDRLFSAGFHQRFFGKGRFERRMASMPLKLLTYPEPGLLGAAAAFAAEHGPTMG